MSNSSEKNGNHAIVILLVSTLLCTGLALYLFFVANGEQSFPKNPVPAGVHAAYKDGIEADNLFAQSPSISLWLLFMIMGFAIVPVLVYHSVNVMRKLCRVFAFDTKKVIIWTVILNLLIIGIVFLPTQVSGKFITKLLPPISNFYPKLAVYLIFNGVGAAFCIAGLILSGHISHTMSKRITDNTSTTLYYTLYRSQMSLLLLLGLLLSVGILATSYMYQIHVELFGEQQPFISKEGVAVEGIFFTFILAVFFFPARRELQHFGYRIVTEECGTRPAEGKNWQDWSAERQAMIDLLKLETDIKQLAGWYIPVLAPLATSILPHFLQA